MTAEPPLSAAAGRTLASLVDRIFPATPDGPGAVEIGVVDFIERQLAGAWGGGATLYLSGPFETPADGGHGWQWNLTPAQLYRRALAEVEEHCRRRYGRELAELAAEQQDAVVAALAGGEIEPGFFDVLHGNLLEGLFADPRYGGNRDEAGWRWLAYRTR